MQLLSEILAVIQAFFSSSQFTDLVNQFFAWIASKLGVTQEAPAAA